MRKVKKLLEKDSFVWVTLFSCSQWWLLQAYDFYLVRIHIFVDLDPQKIRSRDYFGNLTEDENCRANHIQSIEMGC